MVRRLTSFRRARDGTSAIEFALIAPVMLLFMGGIVEMGRAYQTYVAVNRLASRYALSWADCSDTPTGVCGLNVVAGIPTPELGLYTSAYAEQNIAPQLAPVSALGLRMMQVTMSSGGSPSTTYAYPSGATPTAAEIAVARNVIANGQTGVIVTASYTYTPMFFTTLMKPIMGNSLLFSYTIAQLKS